MIVLVKKGGDKIPVEVTSEDQWSNLVAVHGRDNLEVDESTLPKSPEVESKPVEKPKPKPKAKKAKK